MLAVVRDVIDVLHLSAGKVLQEPVGPPDSVCQHHVCRACIGGKMRLKPSCSWCKKHEQFVENSQLKIIVQCFKTICQYLATPSVATNLANAKYNNGGTNNLMAIIQEGVTLGDPCCDAGPVTQGVTVFPAVLHHVNKLTLKRRRRRGGCGRYRRLLLNNTASPNTDTENSASLLDVDMSANQQQVALTNNVETINNCATNGCEQSLSLDSDTAAETPHDVIPCKKVKTHNTADEPVTTPPLDASVVKSRKSLQKTLGCRCGLATRKPGSLTCCGQRCPCYSAFKGCTDCICRGCRNPRGDQKPRLSETSFSGATSSDNDVMIVVDM